jgi:hypothetical protein
MSGIVNQGDGDREEIMTLEEGRGQQAMSFNSSSVV